MKIVYSPDYSFATRQAPLTLSTGQSTPSKAISHAVGAVALFNSTIGSCVIEASTNNFSTTIFQLSLSSVAGDFVADLVTPVAAATWRVRATASGQIGQLYAGYRIDIRNPSYPMRFEKNIYTDTRATLGGIQYGKFLYEAYQADFNWDLVPDSEIDVWRLWYQKTSGFHKPFVVVDPVDSVPVLFSGAGEFPLSLSHFNLYSGSARFSEIM